MTIVFERIDDDATAAPPQTAAVFGAKASGRVPARMDEPFEWGIAIDVPGFSHDVRELVNDRPGTCSKCLSDGNVRLLRCAQTDASRSRKMSDLKRKVRQSRH